MPRRNAKQVPRPVDSVAGGRQDRLRPRRRHDYSPLEHAAITASIPLEPRPLL
jgi:hypothetical protein